jgi:putative copper export protein
VVNAADQRVDVNGGLVLPTDAREMDVALRPGLLPGVYVVIWHTQSVNDGQVFSGAFPFSIANADGSVPASDRSALPDQGQPAVGSGQIDGVVIFRWLMVVLVDLGVIFWVGGKILHSFVLDAAGTETGRRHEIVQLNQQRLIQHYSLPILRVLFFANCGVLAGQALALSGGRWDLMLAPTLLMGLLTNGNVGVFWLGGQAVIALAMMLEAMVLFARQHAPDSAGNDTSKWLDLLLGLLLLVVTVLISYTTASGVTQGVLPVLVGALYLLAATVWIGGIWYLTVVYLPILRERAAGESAFALLMVLQRFSPLAMSAAVIMILSGVYSAVVRQTAFGQMRAVGYGAVLIVEIVGVVVLLMGSVWIFFGLLPALEKEYERYVGERNSSTGTDLSCPREPKEQAHGHDKSVPAEKLGTHRQDSGEEQGAEVADKVQEQGVRRYVERVSMALRYMVWPGVMVILCMGLMSVLVGGF